MLYQVGASLLFYSLASILFSPAGQQRKTTPAQVDPFFTQGDTLSSEDLLDDTWVTVFGCVVFVLHSLFFTCCTHFIL